MAERLRLMEKLRENAPPGEESALFRSSEVNPPHVSAMCQERTSALIG